MPVHLPPISRRGFLGASITAGISLVFKRPGIGAESASNDNLFALLSDPHVAEDSSLVIRGANMADNLKSVCGQVESLPKKPSGVLVNGDCAYLSGKAEDYSLFMRLIQPLREAGIPLHMTLGNHDDRENFRKSIRESKEGQGNVTGKHVSILKTARANWFLLDSLEAVNKTPGSLGEAQLEWLARSLDANAGKPAILFGHHNPHLQEVENKTGLKDTPRLLEIIRPRKQVKAFIFGHTHNWEVKTDEAGIHMINLPPVGYVFNAKRPNGWVQAELKDAGMRLKLNSLDARHPEAGQVKELNWRSS